MKLHLFEATNGVNWGKFAVGRLEFEGVLWRSEIDDARRSLLPSLGWGDEHVWVLDLQTGEGAFFAHGGYARGDLQKHKIWVCPMFEPFLTWLYKQSLDALYELPQVVELTPDQAPAALHGYRRRGPVARPRRRRHRGAPPPSRYLRTTTRGVE